MIWEILLPNDRGILFPNDRDILLPNEKLLRNNINFTQQEGVPIIKLTLIIV